MTGPLHVTHVYKDVYPPIAGGIEKHIDDVRRSMPDVRSDVIVCARSRHTTTVPVGTGEETRVAEFGRMLSTPVSPRFPLVVRRAAGDVFHVHMPNPLAEISAVGALRGRPYVVSYHADIVRQAWLMPAYRHLLDACLSRSRKIVVGSRRTGENSPALRAFQDRVELVPYSIDVNWFDPGAVPAADVEALRARYGTPLVVAVGRLVYYKGFEHLIDAAGRLEASVVIAGGGPLEEPLRVQATRHSRVHVLGGVDEAELRTLLAAADCFVLPSTSRAESFGIATLEAQAMGIPAIVTDVGTGTTEAIEPGKSGLVIAPGSVAEIVSAIESLLGDDARRAAMGRRARERVMAEHSLQAQARRLRDIYERAAA